MDKNYIKQLIGNHQPSPVIFEIGSADGLDTEEFVNTFKNTDFRMYCFEPDVRNILEFRKRINDPRVTLIEAAIGLVDSDSFPFNTSAKNKETGEEFIYSSSFRKPGPDLFMVWPMFGDYRTFEETTVKSIRLDTFVKENNIQKIDFVWADVQGCEDWMIIGGRETFADRVNYLYTEYDERQIYVGEPNLKTIMALLENNYRIIQDFGTEVLLKNWGFG